MSLGFRFRSWVLGIAASGLATCSLFHAAAAGEPAGSQPPSWQMVIAPKQGPPVVAEFHHLPDGTTTVHHRLIRPGEYLGGPKAEAYSPVQIVPRHPAPVYAPPTRSAPFSTPEQTAPVPTPIEGPSLFPSTRRDTPRSAQVAPAKSPRPAQAVRNPFRLTGQESPPKNGNDPGMLVLPPLPADPDSKPSEEKKANADSKTPIRQTPFNESSKPQSGTPATPASSNGASAQERAGDVPAKDAPAATVPFPPQPAVTKPILPAQPPLPPAGNRPVGEVPAAPSRSNGSADGALPPPAHGDAGANGAAPVLPHGAADQFAGTPFGGPVGYAPPHRPTYTEIYESIPFNRTEYNANPAYRHEATMEILFGQLRPTVIHKNQPAPVIQRREYDYVTPYSYWNGRGYVNYNFYYPRPTVYRQY